MVGPRELGPRVPANKQRRIGVISTVNTSYIYFLFLSTLVFVLYKEENGGRAYALTDLFINVLVVVQSDIITSSGIGEGISDNHSLLRGSGIKMCGFCGVAH